MIRHQTALRNATPTRFTTTLETWDGRQVVTVRDRADLDLRRSTESLNAEDARLVMAAADFARTERRPLVLLLASARPDVHLGIEGLHALGRAATALTRCSGVIPILAGVRGPLVGAPALLAGLVDHLVLGPNAMAYVNGPHTIASFTGETLSARELGGAELHASTTGLAALSVSHDDEVEDALADLLMRIPASVDHLGEPPRSDDPADRATPELATVLPDRPTGSYDVRRVIESIVDDGDLLELRARWAPNLVTALASVDGHPVGIVANQPCQIAGTLDIAASQKGARFVAFCDAFNLSLLTIVDTPGFSPGKDLEWRGMIRHGAQLAFAYARASVPRVSLTLRKSYGGAYIVMDSKTMGNDITLAWPTAEIAVMGAKGAAQILNRGADAETLSAHEADYEQRLLNPWVACDRGLVDMVIEPERSRQVVAASLAMLVSKRERLPNRLHDNIPL